MEAKVHPSGIRTVMPRPSTRMFLLAFTVITTCCASVLESMTVLSKTAENTTPMVFVVANVVVAMLRYIAITTNIDSNFLSLFM